MKFFLVTYDGGPDYAETRKPFREAHLAHVRAALERGEVLLAGALTDPIDTSVLVLRAPSAAHIEAFVNADPYVQAGIIQSWRVREWMVVAGVERLD